jgi:site-specific recombinase XerD
MPRPKSDTPSYCLHKRTGRAYVTLNGQQRMLPGSHGSEESRGAYDRLVAEWLTNGRTLAGTSSASPTVSMIAAAFWRHAQSYYRRADGTPTTEPESIRQALRVLRRLYGDTPAIEFGPKRLKQLREHMLSEKQTTDPKTAQVVRRPGWCRTYANRQIKRVQLMFRWAASEELIPASVPAALDTVGGLRKGSAAARESDPVRPVADEMVEATLPHLPRALKAMVQLQRLCGARGGELFQLRTCDIDRSGKVWKYRPTSHKTAHHEHDRMIRFGPQAQAVLEPLLRLNLSEYVFQPAETAQWYHDRQKASRKSPMTPSQRARAEAAKGRQRKHPFGARYTKDSYAKAVIRACDRAFPPPSELVRVKIQAQKANGRKYLRWETKAEWRERLGDTGWQRMLSWRAGHRWHPHQLRHAAASTFRRDGDFEAAKILLGHRTDSMTQLYAQRDERKADEVIARLG